MVCRNPDDGWYFTWDSDLDEFQLNYWSTLKVGAEAEDEIEWEVQLDLEWDEKLVIVVLFASLTSVARMGY
jgi:hypothetical protein